MNNKAIRVDLYITNYDTNESRDSCKPQRLFIVMMVIKLVVTAARHLDCSSSTYMCTACCAVVFSHAKACCTACAMLTSVDYLFLLAAPHNRSSYDITTAVHWYHGARGIIYVRVPQVPVLSVIWLDVVCTVARITAVSIFEKMPCMHAAVP
eukprot:4125-Heterococcus_DN1.PRE.5